jgi:hypothetical protein
MVWIASDPHKCLGEVVDTGHCMRHVQVVAGVAHSSKLRKGEKARGAKLTPGTIVGTFDDTGCYANATDGSSHIAVFLKETPEGLLVIDQWVGQVVHERVVRWKNGAGPACDDADRYYVVQSADAA